MIIPATNNNIPAITTRFFTTAPPTDIFPILRIMTLTASSTSVIEFAANFNASGSFIAIIDKPANAIANKPVITAMTTNSAIQLLAKCVTPMIPIMIRPS